jgi:hypothetical protein
MGNGPGEKLSHHHGLGVAAHQHREQLVGLLQKRDKGGEKCAEKRTCQDFAKDVPVEDAHSGNPTA